MTLTVINRLDLRKGLCLLSLATISLVFDSTHLQAGLFSKKHIEPCDCEEEQQSPCCLEDRCPISGNGWYVSGKYLYWGVWEESLQLAGKGDTYPGTIKAIPFDWTSGYKVSMGGNFCDGWGVCGQYTYLRPHGSKTMQSSTGKNLYPFLIPDIAAGGFQWDLGSDLYGLAVVSNFTNTHAYVNLKYNLFDLEVTRAFCCLPRFDLILVGGAQGGLIKQTINGSFLGNATAKYKGLDVAPQQTIPFTVNMAQSWRFGGAGLKIGLDGEYHHPCGFLFYTGGRFNLLFGQYRNSYGSAIKNIGFEEGIIDTPGNRTVIATPTLEGFYRYHGRETFLDFAPNFQADLGLGWEYLASCWSIRLDAGYEATYWFNLSQLRVGLSNSVDYIQPFSETTSVIFSDAGETQRISSSVGLQGLVVSLEIKF